MYGADPVNELLNAIFDVPVIASNLPGMVGVPGAQGTQRLYPSGPKQGTGWSPTHAYINVETGALRMKTDGTDPDPGIGTLYTAPAVIDWSSAISDYRGMLRLARLCRENSAVPTRITISYRS